MKWATVKIDGYSYQVPDVLLGRIAELEAALLEIRDLPYCDYTANANSYGLGVADGHRLCSSIARKALEQNDEG